MFGLKRSASARAIERAVVTGYSIRDFRDRFQVANASLLSHAGDAASE
jgi:hypothetical protein